MYRVVCNDVLRHLEWIVVRDRPDGAILVAGPYLVERDALMHCNALNRQTKSPFGWHIPITTTLGLAT